MYWVHLNHFEKMFITGITALLCLLEVTTAHVIVNHDADDLSRNEYLYDDMILTKEQHLMMKERGFFVPGKWPIRNGKVTVLFYFDDSIPVGDLRRTVFQKSAEVYKESTCIEWIQTTASDTRHKVQVYSGVGCNANVGMIKDRDNRMSLEPDCSKVGTIIHEMGHTMGLVHTQSRTDRDQYVKVWFENVKSGMEHNFEIETGAELFGIPYDYLSMMHYQKDFFTKNGSFTLTPRDPFALFVMGQDRDSFAWSDEAFLNMGYQCDAIFKQSCGPRDCKNGGYVGKTCKCSCPQNTKGDKCETKTGPFFSYTPKCGGVVDSEGDIESDGYGVASTRDRCVFHIKAPKCYKPQITIKEAKFYWQSCSSNMLALQVSEDYFGYVFCDDKKVAIGKPFVSDTSEAAVYYFTGAAGFSQYGFKANVQFLKDPLCKNPGVIVTKPTTTTTTTTTAAPVGSCIKRDLGGGTYAFQTPNYPSKVAAMTQCSVEFTTSEFIRFSKVNVSMRFDNGDSLQVKDALMGTRYSGYRSDVLSYGIWPFTITFSAGQPSGNGFQVTLLPASDLPTPCNGETITLEVGQSRTIYNPLYGRKFSGARCAFMVKTGKYNKVEYKASRLGADQVYVNPYLPEHSSFTNLDEETVSSWNDMVRIYFKEAQTMNNWNIKFTVV